MILEQTERHVRVKKIYSRAAPSKGAASSRTHDARKHSWRALESQTTQELFAKLQHEAKIVAVQGGIDMAWSKPIAREVKCGMEINMYGPGEDDERGGERDVI